MKVDLTDQDFLEVYKKARPTLAMAAISMRSPNVSDDVDEYLGQAYEVFIKFKKRKERDSKLTKEQYKSELKAYLVTSFKNRKVSAINKSKSNAKNGVMFKPARLDLSHENDCDTENVIFLSEFCKIAREQAKFRTDGITSSILHETIVKSCERALARGRRYAVGARVPGARSRFSINFRQALVKDIYEAFLNEYCNAENDSDQREIEYLLEKYKGRPLNIEKRLSRYLLDVAFNKVVSE